MACYLISYDLVGEPRDYEALVSAIKEYGTWAHITDSFWAVVTEEKATDIRANLQQHMDNDDRLFVIKSGKEAAWYNVIGRNEWLKKHI